LGYPPQGAYVDVTTLLERLTEARAGYLDDLYAFAHHLSHLFPEDSDETVSFAAGGTDNAFGDWAEIKDNNNVTLSSKAATEDLYISSLTIELASLKDVIYLVQIGYGDGTVGGTTAAGSHRFAAPLTKFVDIVQQIRVRPLKIPAGETIYYRMKCETADATCEVCIRYHYH